MVAEQYNRDFKTTHDPDEIETRLFINGEFVPAQQGHTFLVINPATESVFATVHEAREPDVELAVKAAEQAFPAWSARGGYDRASFLYKLADLFEKNNSRFAWLEAQSMGRPVSTYSELPSTSRLSMVYLSGFD
jgi:aldehyde dehydrogenase (NAD+)